MQPQLKCRKGVEIRKMLPNSSLSPFCHCNPLPIGSPVNIYTSISGSHKGAFSKDSTVFSSFTLFSYLFLMCTPKSSPFYTLFSAKKLNTFCTGKHFFTFHYFYKYFLLPKILTKGHSNIVTPIKC